MCIIFHTNVFHTNLDVVDLQGVDLSLVVFCGILLKYSIIA